jgi:hypothetical protein
VEIMRLRGLGGIQVILQRVDIRYTFAGKMVIGLLCRRRWIGSPDFTITEREEMLRLIQGPECFNPFDAHGVLFDIFAMTEEIRKLLEDLRHDLVTMHGMGAFDGVAPHITFTVNNEKLIRRIDEALGDRPTAGNSQPSVNYGSEVQYFGDPEDWKPESREDENGSEG